MVEPRWSLGIRECGEGSGNFYPGGVVASFLFNGVLQVMSLFIAAVLVASAVPHLLSPYRYLDLVSSYPYVGGFAAVIVAVVLPFVSTVVSIALVAGWMRRGALVLSVLLGGLYSIIHALGMLPDGGGCGCFGGTVGNAFSGNTSLAAYVLLVVAGGRAVAEFCASERRVVSPHVDGSE